MRNSGTGMASAEAVAAMPGGGGARHRLVVSRPDRVAGEMEIRTAHLDGAGHVHPATIFGFAHDLAAEGAGTGGMPPRLVDAKTLTIDPRPANRLTGEAVPVAGAVAPSVWQATVSDDMGRVLGVLAFTFQCRAGIADPDAPERLATRHASQDSARPESRPESRPASRPESRPESRLDRIVTAAAEVIARKGFAQATIREIAEAADMHVPSLYAHVSGKEELLEHAFAREMDLLEADLDRAVGEGSALARIERMVGVAIDVADRRRRQLGLINRELKSLRPEARARVLARYRALIGRYEAVVQEGIAAGEFAPVDPLVAANFLDMAADIWGLRQFFFSEMPLDHYRKAALAFALHGLCGPARQEDRGPGGAG